MTPFAGWLLTGAAAATAFLALGLWNLGADSAPPFCLVRLLLDLPCPGCGMTRALQALARGDLAAAVRFHPLAPALGAEAAVLWGWWGLRLWGRRAPSRALVAVSPAAGWWTLLYANGAVFLALWAGRLAAGSLPR